MKPHIWYSEYYDSYFVGFKDTKEPTSKYPSLSATQNNWGDAAEWFRRRHLSDRGVEMLISLPACKQQGGTNGISTGTVWQP